MGVDTRGNIKNALRRSHGRYFDDLADINVLITVFALITGLAQLVFLYNLITRNRNRLIYFFYHFWTFIGLYIESFCLIFCIPDRTLL